MAQDASIRIYKSTNGSETRGEIGILFKNLETDFLSTLFVELTLAQLKKAHDEADKSLAMFYPKYKEKYSLKEFRINNINLFNIYDLENSTCYYP